MLAVPTLRIRSLTSAPMNPQGAYVLYWMIAHRRTHANFALQRAVQWAVELQRPLIILEALRINYRWASDRLHRFVLQGMRDQQARLKELPVTYHPYVEPVANHGRGLLERMARQAAIVVTDDFPCFFLPSMLKLVSRRLEVQLEAVDANGLYPLRATEQVFPTAYAFRRHLQKSLPEHLDQFPLEDPLTIEGIPDPLPLPADVLAQWPAASEALLAGEPAALAELSIDHQVGPAAFDGGELAARRTLDRFLHQGLNRYGEDRNHPDCDASSQLSPYLHFGHISAHSVFREVAQREGWDASRLAAKANGARNGWWGMSAPAESFLDELITWRELGYNMCAHRADYDRYESLPAWAQATLEEHAADLRDYVYTLADFEAARTHDEVWNAAQRQLVRDGRMHNYLRMLWGKKILEWSPSPRVALAVMIELNNKYAVDGRNPNSYSGIFWVLGRYDRAWGPERPIYGKIRYMSSDNTLRKLQMSDYLKRYSARRVSQQQLFD